MFAFHFVKTIAIFIAIVLLLPLVSIVWSISSPDTDTWQHLVETVFAEYVINSILLAAGSAFVAIIIGTYSAYIVTRFKLRVAAFVQIALLLPLAMPAYIIAYTYTGLFDFSSPLHSFLRALFNAGQDRVLPDIRSLFGAICMLGLVLYPYVFILARAAFKQQSNSLKEVSAMAGVSAFRHFFKVELPIARPAILTGAALVIMEALADYGTVAYFGVNTFSTGIYRTWFGMGNREVAAQLSTVLCVFVFMVLALEKYFRRDARKYVSDLRKQTQLQSISLSKDILLTVLCLAAPLFAFFVPVTQLAWWAFFVADINLEGFTSLLFNSFYVATLASIVLVLLSLLFSATARMASRTAWQKLNQVLSLGYALPGIVIAVGVIIVAGSVDRQINYALMSMFDYRPGLLTSGGVAILIFAYAVRYLSVALQNTENAYSRVNKSVDEAALFLNHSRWALFKKIHLPLLTGSMLSASLLVFVDVLKELPATLVLRPFNFNTLAVRAYELATDERLIDAALPAISIVAVGLLPVSLLIIQLQRSDKLK